MPGTVTTKGHRISIDLGLPTNFCKCWATGAGCGRRTWIFSKRLRFLHAAASPQPREGRSENNAGRKQRCPNKTHLNDPPWERHGYFVPANLGLPRRGQQRKVSSGMPVPVAPLRQPRARAEWVRGGRPGSTASRARVRGRGVMCNNCCLWRRVVPAAKLRQKGPQANAPPALVLGGLRSPSGQKAAFRAR